MKNGQTLESVFQQSTCFYTIWVWHFCFLASEIPDLLQRVERVMHSNIVSLRSKDAIFKRISVDIHKELAAKFYYEIS